MENTFHTLAEQAGKLQQELQAIADNQTRVGYNLSSLQECAAEIQRLVHLVGNDRTAALSSKDVRKVMAELQDRADQLQELVGQ